MSDQKQDEPQIVTHRIPSIDLYQVSEDELNRIEEGYAHVGQDFSFAIASLSIGASFVVALLSASVSDRVFSFFVSIIIISGVVFLYTGIRWWSNRKKAPDAIAKIRSRKIPISPQE